MNQFDNIVLKFAEERVANNPPSAEEAIQLLSSLPTSEKTKVMDYLQSAQELHGTQPSNEQQQNITKELHG